MAESSSYLPCEDKLRSNVCLAQVFSSLINIGRLLAANWLVSRKEQECSRAEAIAARDRFHGKAVVLWQLSNERSAWTIEWPQEQLIFRSSVMNMESR